MAPLHLAPSLGSANRGLRREVRGKREDTEVFIPLTPFPAVSPGLAVSLTLLSMALSPQLCPSDPHRPRAAASP